MNNLFTVYKNLGNENIVILLFISDVRCLYSSRTADFNRP